MTGRTSRPASLEDAILVDEIGIEAGIHGDFRLRSSYQPIFARAGDLLCPVAVEGLISSQRAGIAVPPDEFFSTVAPEDRPYLDSLCRALHLRNHRNIGVDGLELHFAWLPRPDGDLEAELAGIHALDGQLGESGLDARSLVCEIAGADVLDRSFLSPMAEAMRGIGVRVATAFGSGSTQETLDLIAPEIVRIDGGWVRKLCRESATVELFGLLVSRFHERGAKALVEGIDDAAQLRVALETGADLLQGDHLARAAPVGTVFEETRLTVRDLLAERPNVLRFGR